METTFLMMFMIKFSKNNKKSSNPEDHFKIYYLLIKNISKNSWPLSDPFHLLKGTRTKVLSREMSELYNYIQNENCISDRTSQLLMKDSYTLTLFGFESFINSIHVTQSYFNICQFFLIYEKIQNSRLNIETRFPILKASFSVHINIPNIVFNR